MTERDPADLGFDPDALREKYRREREKRLRADGNDQYVEVSGAFARFAEDPYAEPGFARDPLEDDVDVALIGGGFGGLLGGARLRQRGVQDLRIVEKGGDVGGTWYWNRYPGIACDVESYSYLPLLEEMGYIPTMKFAGGFEIMEYCQAMAEKFGFYDHCLFHTTVDRTEWDEASGRWTVYTDRGDAMRARFVMPAPTASLSSGRSSPSIDGHGNPSKATPSTPPSWDYEYTCGDKLRKPHRSPRQARSRHHRYRRDSAVQCYSRARRQRESSCTCSSARRHRSTCATTARPTRNGPPACSRAGTSSAWTTSRS